MNGIVKVGIAAAGGTFVAPHIVKAVKTHVLKEPLSESNAKLLNLGAQAGGAVAIWWALGKFAG